LSQPSSHVDPKGRSASQPLLPHSQGLHLQQQFLHPYKSQRQWPPLFNHLVNLDPPWGHGLRRHRVLREPLPWLRPHHPLLDSKQLPVPFLRQLLEHLKRHPHSVLLLRLQRQLPPSEPLLCLASAPHQPLRHPCHSGLQRPLPFPGFMCPSQSQALLPRSPDSNSPSQSQVPHQLSLQLHRCQLPHLSWLLPVVSQRGALARQARHLNLLDLQDFKCLHQWAQLLR
jgi:hypothetical protein